MSSLLNKKSSHTVFKATKTYQQSKPTLSVIKKTSLVALCIWSCIQSPMALAYRHCDKVPIYSRDLNREYHSYNNQLISTRAAIQNTILYQNTNLVVEMRSADRTTGQYKRWSEVFKRSSQIIQSLRAHLIEKYTKEQRLNTFYQELLEYKSALKFSTLPEHMSRLIDKYFADSKDIGSILLHEQLSLIVEILEDQRASQQVVFEEFAQSLITHSQLSKEGFENFLNQIAQQSAALASHELEIEQSLRDVVSRRKQLDIEMQDSMALLADFRKTELQLEKHLQVIDGQFKELGRFRDDCERPNPMPSRFHQFRGAY